MANVEEVQRIIKKNNVGMFAPLATLLNMRLPSVRVLG